MLVESSFAGLLPQQNPQIHFSFRPQANSELGRSVCGVAHSENHINRSKTAIIGLLRRSGPEQLIDATLNSNPRQPSGSRKSFFLRLASEFSRARPHRRGHCGRLTPLYARPAVLHVATRTIPSDNLTMYGMHNGLKPVLCSKLVVDVVEMVTKCLQADPKFPCGFGRILTV